MTSRLDLAVNELKNNLLLRNAKHGAAPHNSIHETLGILVEEFDEFRIEVKHNDLERQYAELCDIATAAIVGMASLRGTSCEVQETFDFQGGN